MKKYKAIWKVEPTFELNENEDLEEAEHDRLLDITMNPHDYIEFEEVEEKTDTIQERIKELFVLLDKEEMEDLSEELSNQARETY